ncbi:hypothetical protein ANDSL2ph1_CDS0032 [Acetoanaerobium phage ANDSL2_ph1]
MKTDLINVSTFESVFVFEIISNYKTKGEIL